MAKYTPGEMSESAAIERAVFEISAVFADTVLESIDGLQRKYDLPSDTLAQVIASAHLLNAAGVLAQIDGVTPERSAELAEVLQNEVSEHLRRWMR